MIDKLIDEESLPSSFRVRPDEDMALTYVSKGTMSRELRGFAAAFDGRGLVDMVTAKEQMEEPVEVPLGRTALMGRNNLLVVRIGHSQEVGEEYAHIMDAMEASAISGLRSYTFRPHITLGSFPTDIKLDVKNHALREAQLVLPQTVTLGAMMTIPANPTRRR